MALAVGRGRPPARSGRRVQAAGGEGHGGEVAAKGAEGQSRRSGRNNVDYKTLP
jgi:hypothetical protein